MQRFLSQTTLDAQAISYAMMELKKGDVVEVVAVCSKAGELKRTFNID